MPFNNSINWFLVFKQHFLSEQHLVFVKKTKIIFFFFFFLNKFLFFLKNFSIEQQRTCLSMPANNVKSTCNTWKVTKGVEEPDPWIVLFSTNYSILVIIKKTKIFSCCCNHPSWYTVDQAFSCVNFRISVSV